MMFMPRHYPSSPICPIEGTDGGTKQTPMGSWIRIWTAMTLLPYPFVAAGASTRLLLGSRFGGIEWGATEGSLVATSYSEAKFVRIACYSPIGEAILVFRLWVEII